MLVRYTLLALAALVVAAEAQHYHGGSRGHSRSRSRFSYDERNNYAPRVNRNAESNHLNFSPRTREVDHRNEVRISPEKKSIRNDQRFRLEANRDTRSGNSNKGLLGNNFSDSKTGPVDNRNNIHASHKAIAKHNTQHSDQEVENTSRFHNGNFQGFFDI